MLTVMNPADVHGTLKKHMLVDGLDLVFDLKRSQGSYIYDSRNGRRFLVSPWRQSPGQMNRTHGSCGRSTG